MIDFYFINKIFVFLIIIIGVWVAFLVFFTDKRNKINQFFPLSIFFLLSLIIFSHFSHYTNPIYQILIWKKFFFIAIFFFFISIYYFSVYFPKVDKRYPIIDKIIIITELIFLFLTIFTDFIIKDAKIESWGTNIVFGGGKYFLFATMILYTFLIVGQIVKKYFILNIKEKLQVQYFLIGFLIFSGANLVFNMFYPLFFNSYKYYYLGDYSAIFLFSFTAYAIVKRELLGIKTLLTQVLIVIISIILFVDVLFLSDDLTMQLLKIGILLAFLYFSREMVKSVKKEKEAREELEKINEHLEEKTQDLESLLSLNEMISAGLEIENSVQNIMDAVPEKLGHLGIMGTFLIRYNKNIRKAYAYITTESDEMREAKKLLAKPKLSDYSLCIDTKTSKSYGLIIKSILENEIEKGSDLADFVSPPLDRPTALAIQKKLGGKAFVSIPMTIRSEKRGALVFIFTKHINEINQRDLDIAKAFAQHVSVVMDNLHFYHHLNKNIEELTRAKDRLKETLSIKNDFLHIVSHQLRTPLTAMRGFISMWNEGDFDSLPKDKIREIKVRIVNNSERLNNIVNDMVMAMESEGELKVEFKPVNLGKILEGNIEMLKPSYEKKGLYLKYKAAAKNIPEIEADEKLLLNVFMNLIDNAEKYTEKGGLTVAVGQDGNNIKISFIDTGIGLSKEDKKILFKKFSRGAKSNYINPNGSGLGLFIIKQIIAKHRGKIKALSKGAGKGSTFTITLPVRQGR